MGHEIAQSVDADGVQIATVTTGVDTPGRFGAKAKHRVLCEMRQTDDADTRWAVAVVTATAICGTDRRGRPVATISMIGDVLRALEQVAGCNAAGAA